MYKSARVPQPAELMRKLNLFLNGMEQVISATKEQLGLKVPEGKDTMSFEAYELLTKNLFSARIREIF